MFISFRSSELSEVNRDDVDQRMPEIDSQLMPSTTKLNEMFMCFEEMMRLLHSPDWNSDDQREVFEQSDCISKFVEN